MNHMKYFGVIALLLLGAVGYMVYGQYRNMSETQHKLLINEGRSLTHFTEAFRKTYQHAFLAHAIPLDNKTVHLLPVKTIDEISKRFSKKVNDDVQVRTVSDRPRNPKNMANAFEKEMIDYFRAHPGVKKRIVKKADAFYYFHPLVIEKGCLKCHGARADAPPSIRDNYTEAYGYRIGEIRGLSSVRITRSATVVSSAESFRNAAVTTILLYLFLLFAIYELIRKMNAMERHYTRDLEKRVENKTREVARQKEVFETLFEKSSDGIFILDGQKIIQCNEKIIEMLRYDTKDQLLGKRPAMLSPKYQPDGELSLEKGDEMVALAFRNGRHQFEWMHVRSDGEEFLADVTLMPIVLDGREVLYVTWRDISERKKAEAKLIEQQNALHHQAHHDALTNLPNRSLLLDRLEQGIKRAERNATVVAVLFFDIDNFKKINDSLGHHIGDRVLVNVAERLRKIVRGEDTLARLGGDEFTIVAECSHQTRFSSRLAEDILALFAEPIVIEGHTLHITVSIGISFYPQDTTEVGDLLKFADAAMYKAKNEGKNTCRYYSPEITQLLVERVALEEELRRAIEKNEFVVYYQPQFDAVEKKVTGIEALIRWQHPTKGIVMPDTFVPLAEETGLIIEIDRWVMRTAMKQVLAWRAEGKNPGKLSLNLSVQQLMNNEFIQLLREEIAAIGFRPEWLELEVTEREMMQDPDKSIQQLDLLSQMGISIAIDDFGTGYSSLSYLKQFPVDKLKIDRSFIKEVVSNQDDASITRAVIALAKSLNLNVIAEGAETSGQADFLVQSGCSTIQGYFFGRPMSADEMENVISTQTEGQ
jgi:diguanylate cyclase (GGDEF)-like protein/PAS domain S-box-containing protein